MLLPIKSSPSSFVSAQFGSHLEAIRGFAALLVIWQHAISFPYTLDPNYSVEGILGYLAPSHFSVLLFLVLSGYVIGLTNQKPLHKATIKEYVRKRLLRIYPIYAVCMLFAVVVGWDSNYSWATILGNFAFLQVALTDIVRENAPSWSLHFEVLYYLLFIPLSLLRINPVVAVGGSLLVGVANYWLLPAHPLLSSYSFGFAFWTAGLALARYARLLPNKQPPYQLLLALLLLFASLRGFDAPETIFRKLTVAVVGERLQYPKGHSFTTILSFYDLSWLPYAVMGVLVFAHKAFRFRQLLLVILFALPGLTMVHIIRDWHEFDWSLYGLASVFYLLSLLLFLRRISWFEQRAQALIGLLSRIGSISYGLYIVHFPVMKAMSHVLVFSGTALTHWFRFGLFVVLSLFLAYLLEKKLQPWIKARLM